jgi:hypothetical protein
VPVDILLNKRLLFITILVIRVNLVRNEYIKLFSTRFKARKKLIVKTNLLFVE